MDIFASLGYATDNPSPDFFRRKPEPRNAPIISITMWKMIFGQAIYQLLVVFTVHYAGWDLFNPNTEFEIEILQTLVLNIYVWMQFFNQHNCRRVDNKLDIWYQGVLRNPWFIGVQLMTVVGQFVIIFKGGEAFDTTPLTGAQWGWSLLFGVMSIPLGALIRQIPDRLVQELFNFISRVWHVVWTPLKSGLSKLNCRRRRKNDEEQQPQGPHQEEMGPVENILHMMNLSPNLNEDEVPMTAEQREALASSARKRKEETEKQTRHINLHGLVEAAKLGREYVGATLELHPRTLKDDPILRESTTSTIPPSQDEQFMKFVALSAPRPRAAKRRQAQEQRQAATQAKSKKSNFTWEGILRTKRR